MKFLPLALVLFITLAAPAHGQVTSRVALRPPPTADGSTPISTPRVKHPLAGQVWIGEGAPDFELDASSGTPVKLSRLRGDFVMLVFADRRRDLTGLLLAQKALVERGVRVVGVCHEKQQALMAQAARDGIDQLVLADVTGEISGMYGLFDWQRQETVPGFFVLDREGVVRLGLLGRLLPTEDAVELARYAMSTM